MGSIFFYDILFNAYLRLRLYDSKYILCCVVLINKFTTVKNNLTHSTLKDLVYILKCKIVRTLI